MFKRARSQRNADPVSTAEPDSTGEPNSDAAAQRRQLVEDLAARGVADQRVLDAVARVPREHFVASHLAGAAYDDRPLSIGCGQTISQPYMVAVMMEAAEIEPTDRALEIGTGSGYGAAVLGALAHEVYTVERIATLADDARRRLETAGYDNVHVEEGDGSKGWPDAAPYDVVMATASPKSVPPALVAQLADGGRLVIPVGPRRRNQTLVRIRRQGDELQGDDLGPVRFVPLV